MMEFSAAQKAAITHKNGPMMVIAGPGSGKTMVLTNRIAWLVKEAGVPPEQILVITFTRAAAEEMESRYRRLAGGQVTFGTFHSVFYSILKEYDRRTQSGLRLIGGREINELIRSVYQAQYPGERLTPDLCERIADEIARAKNGLKCRDDLASSLMPLLERKMLQMGVIDFDDMQARCLDLLTRDPGVLRALRARYRYLMVDEFQDINPVQYKIVRMLAEPNLNLFVVGDDDQSIYSFRGSDPSIMLSFPEAFPTARIVCLYNNYRSDRRIVRDSSRLIRHNRHRFQKDLKTEHTQGQPVAVRAYADQDMEAEAVLRKIAELPEEWTAAVLYRTHKAGYAFGSCLERRIQEAADPDLKKRLAELKVMTFHASKGLEFDAVFLIQANDSVTPGVSAREGRKHGRKGEGAAEDPLEEERRIFYVAMTRAKHFLHISYTKYQYNKKTRGSEFLREFLGLWSLLWLR